MRLKWEVVFTAFYMFDYVLTAIMLLTNPNWIDLAHFTYIPLVGVHGYLLIRVVLYFLAIWLFRLYSMATMKALTVFFIALSTYNIVAYLLYPV